MISKGFPSNSCLVIPLCHGEELPSTPLHFRVKGKYSTTSAMECKVIIRIFMENYYGLYEYQCLHCISFVIIQMYVIDLMVNKIFLYLLNWLGTIFHLIMHTFTFIKFGHALVVDLHTGCARFWCPFSNARIYFLWFE